MPYKATTKPTGYTNNTEVHCSGCGAKLYVRAEDARKMGGWECPHCGRRH
jgi:DNA-directed RNA polymerase subunit RPC12/RpoP